MNERSLARRAPFPDAVARPARKAAGRTPVDATPLNIRTSGLHLDVEMRAYVRRRLGLKLGKFALHIERITVRFEDVNGPRGGEDTVSRIKVVLSGLDSVVCEARAADARQAVDLAATRVERAVRRSLRLARVRQPGATAGARRASAARRQAPPATRSPRPNAVPEGGSLIGRRVGQGAPNLEQALERPEKQRRDTPVDTALPGVSATDRKAGGGSTARRNAKRNAPRATVALEDSAKDRPSRKSTRKSANRARPDAKLARRQVRKIQTPSARAARARVQKP